MINAEEQTIPHIPHRALRPFSNDELDELKQKSLFVFNLWRENGSPSSGHIHHIKCSTELQYKMATKNAYLNYEGKHDDEIYLHFINNNIPDFWKIWNSKFKKKVDTNIQINGLTDNQLIANCLVIIFHLYMLTPLII